MGGEKNNAVTSSILRNIFFVIGANPPKLRLCNSEPATVSQLYSPELFPGRQEPQAPVVWLSPGEGTSVSSYKEESKWLLIPTSFTTYHSIWLEPRLMWQ